MPFDDTSLDELRNRKPPLTAQPDFAAFWSRGLESARSEPLAVNFTAKDVPFRGFRVYDVSFNGAAGGIITAELIVPQGACKAPGLAVYHGYGSRRAAAHEILH